MASLLAGSGIVPADAGRQGSRGRQPAQRSAPITTRQATDHHPARDLDPHASFMAERPNELWVADHHLPADAGRISLPCGRSRRLVRAGSSDVGLLGRSEGPRRARRSRHASAHGPKARQRRPSFGSRFAIATSVAFGARLQGSRRSSHRQARSATPTTMRCARSFFAMPSNAS